MGDQGRQMWTIGFEKRLKFNFYNIESKIGESASNKMSLDI